MKVIDTSQVLTVEELKELKKLAALSKTAKFVVSLVFSVLMFVGIDHLVEWLEHK